MRSAALTAALVDIRVALTSGVDGTRTCELHISLGCAPGEFYVIFFKGQLLLNAESQRTLFLVE